MAGETSGEDMRDDKGAYDEKSVESKIAAHLNAINGGDPEPPKPEPVDDEPEADDDVRLSDDDSDGDDDEPSPKPDADDGTEAGEDDTDADGDNDVAIDEAHYHAAVSAGWKPEQISGLLKADPELATQTFEKLYRDNNEVSRLCAQIGRTRMQLEEQAAQQPVQPQPQQIEDPLVAKLNKLKADPEHADDPLIGLVEEMIKSRPQQPQQQLSQQQQPQRQPDPEVQRELDLTRVQQVATFLNSDRMKSYEDFYGPAFRPDGMPIYDATGLSPGQVANRRALLDEADAIWLGYLAHEKELSAEEALTKAHLNLTEPLRVQKVREELVGKIKKRAKGARLKPGKSKAPPATEGAKPNETELEARTTQRLAKLKGGA